MGSQQQQQFCLRWNNHQTNLLSVFDDLLQHETLVDVTLACEGLSMRAHKVVLSACSPYFQQLFLENPCKHPIVVLKDIRYTDMKTLVDFMYKGEVNVSHDQLSTLLNVADTLKVKGLAEVTEGMAANTGRRNDTEMPPVLEVQSGTASRRGGGGGAGAISPTTSRRRKRRRTSGGSNSGLSEDVDSRTGVAGGVTGANDLTSDTMAQQHKQQQQQRLPHSMDLPVVPKMEVIQMPYDEEEEEQQREESRREQEEEEEENAEENMPTLRVLDVRGGRDVHGSKVVGGGDGGSVPGLSTGTASSSYSRLNTTGVETTKDRHGRDDNGIEDDEKYVNLNEDDDDDGIEITDLPFTQHLTIEPTASTSALALMGQGPSTSSGPHPNTTTECSLYFPSTSSSSSLPMYDASNMPSASNTQVLEIWRPNEYPCPISCDVDYEDPIRNRLGTGLEHALKMEAEQEEGEAKLPKTIDDCFVEIGSYIGPNKRDKVKVKCLFCSKLFYNKLYNKRRHLASQHPETYDTLDYIKSTILYT